MPDLLVRVGADISQFRENMAAVSSELNKIERQAGQMSAGFERLGRTLSEAGRTLSMAITAPLVGFGAVAIKAAADFDALRRGLIAVTGSAQEADRQLSRLVETAKLPGLGFREAVQAAIQLQAAGFAFERAVRIIEAFGNALALVGRGREDLTEVVRQLSQLEARGKVTADNLRPILERVPQIATIIRETWGTLDSEVLQRLGVTSQQFIDTILAGLERLPRVTSGVRNEIENLRDAMERALAEAGKALIPLTTQLLQFGSRVAEVITDMARWFMSLPEPIQRVSIALAALAAAVGPVLFMFGQITSGAGALIRLFGTLVGNFGLVTSAAQSFGSALSAVFTAVTTGTTGALVGLEATLLSIGQALLVAASALAAFKLGEWLSELGRSLPILDRFLNLLAAFPAAVYDKIVGASRQAAEAQDALAFAVQRLEERLRAHGIVVERGGMSLEQYAQALRAAAERAGLFAGQQDNTERAVARSGAAMLETARKAQELERAQREAQRSAQELEQAMIALGLRTREQIEVERLAAAWRVLLQAYEQGKIAAIDLAQAQANLLERVAQLNEAGLWQVFDKLTVSARQSVAELEQIYGAAARIIRAFTVDGAALPSWWDQLNEAQNEVGRTTQLLSELSSIYMQGLPEVYYKTVETTTKTAGEWDKLGRQVSTIITDMSRGIAEAILHAKNFGDVFKRVLQELAEAVLRFVVEYLVGQLVNALRALVTTELPAVGSAFGALKNMVEEVGRAIARVFGAAPAGAPGAAPAGGGGAGAAPVTTAAGGGGWSAAVTAIGAAVDAVTSVLSYFQGRRIEQDVGRIEVTTRGILNQLTALQNAVNEWLPWLRNLADPLWSAVSLLSGIYDALGRLVRGEAAGRLSVTVNVQAPAGASGEQLARTVADSLVRQLRFAGYQI